ncbi:hypothetical protein SMB34_14580 [Thalassospira permensis NBRC 106175]|uniref:Uncharacterized protein n=1 Tax=Thalassospira permensis NBRC 106175 TaxID=1353532 RepID=A0ABR4TRN5_9PROT|nr:hypothetical protein SMB34_14580 [Thalassospira permensis NBRC 106175]
MNSDHREVMAFARFERMEKLYAPCDQHDQHCRELPLAQGIKFYI